MRTESSQIRNFINGEFVEPIHSLVIPSEVENGSGQGDRNMDGKGEA